MIWLLLLASLVQADELSHTYGANEAVIVWFNKAAVHYTPILTHPFSWLPLCCGELSSSDLAHALSFSEILQGYEMRDSRMEVRFLQESEQKRLCSVQLSTSDLLRLKEAVQKRYWLQLFVDELPAWQPLGKQTTTETFVYSHFHLEIHYNNSHIIQVVGQPTAPVKLEISEQSLDFSYSITWIPTITPFEARLNVYHDDGFFKGTLYCITTFYFFIVAAALYGLVQFILCRMLCKGYIEEPTPEMKTLGSMDNYLAAFKQMAGEVFRAPSYILLFTVCISAGTQLLAVTLSMLFLLILYPVYAESGYTMSLLPVLYSLFSLLGGVRSGSYYRQQRERNWVQVLLLSLLSIPSIISVIVVRFQESSASLPRINTVDGQIFLLVAIPLHIVGTILGRRCFADPHYPCKVNLVQPSIRYQKRWFQQPLFLILPIGFLPFASILLIVYLQFNSLWDFKLFCIYGFGLATFLLLLVAIASCAIAVTYCMICLEDYRWPWVSFLGAGSTAGYIYLLVLYTYLYNNQISELAGEVYLGYMSLMCLFLFLLLGTVGSLAADQFLRLVYAHLKTNM